MAVPESNGCVASNDCVESNSMDDVETGRFRNGFLQPI